MTRLVFLGLFCLVTMACGNDETGKLSKQWCDEKISKIRKFIDVTIPEVRHGYGLAETPEDEKMEKSLHRVMENLPNVFNELKPCGDQYPDLMDDVEEIKDDINRMKKGQPTDDETNNLLEDIPESPETEE